YKAGSGVAMLLKLVAFCGRGRCARFLCLVQKQKTMSMYSKRLFLVAGLSVLCLASACNKDEGEDNSLSQHDRDFMNNATYINLAEVETGDLARQKAESRLVEDYGAMMVSDHGKAHNELSDIAQ